MNLKIDDIVVITQSSEDDTWLEGTLDGITGWFPSNYVQILDELSVNLEENESALIEQQQQLQKNAHSPVLDNKQLDELPRIRYINEFRKSEEIFLEEMSKFSIF